MSSDEEFIAVWESASSAKEASVRLGMSYSGVHSRANRMRGAGIPLKRWPNGRPFGSTLSAGARPRMTWSPRGRRREPEKTPTQRRLEEVVADDLRKLLEAFHSRNR